MQTLANDTYGVFQGNVLYFQPAVEMTTDYNGTISQTCRIPIGSLQLNEELANQCVAAYFAKH